MCAIAQIPAQIPVRVEGEGYLRFALSGRIVYSKSASLIVKDGRLEDKNGGSVIPLIRVPSNADRLEIDSDGTILARTGRDRSELGRLLLAVFTDRKPLAPQGNYLIAKSRPSLEDPGGGVAGLLVVENAPTPAVDSAKNKPATTLIRPGGPQAIVTLPEKVTVAGDRVALGAIATIDAHEQWTSQIESIDFGPTPRAGIALKLTRERVRARIKLLGLKDSEFELTMPEFTTIEADGQIVEPELFIAEALRAATERYGAGIELRVESELAPFKAPLGKLELKAEGAKALKDKIDVTVAIYVDRRRINAKVVTLSGEALVVAVKTNAIVKVRLNSGAITVEATGKAKRDARIGESVDVAVRINDSAVETTLTGTVIAPGLVEVKL
jgi:hypothetical protein